MLMAGKTGLNVSNAKALDDLIAHYTPSDWVGDFVRRYPPAWLLATLRDLDTETFVGSTGHIFVREMKASPLLRRWLAKLQNAGVRFFYRHRCVGVADDTLTFEHQGQRKTERFDAIILACGGGSYARLGSDGAWQAWFLPDEKRPLYPSNVGVVKSWSDPMRAHFGKPLKRVRLWIETHAIDARKAQAHGDVVVSHYGLEGAPIYRLNAALRRSLAHGSAALRIDLLPHIDQDALAQKLRPRAKNAKQSLSNRWRKAGLDPTKIALLYELTARADWQNAERMAARIKALRLPIDGFRPMQEAISSGGGVRKTALDGLQLRRNRRVFVCGEMLDWDAPTGGYLLTACFAMGKAAGEAAAEYLDLR